jgi:hypothetical protein
MPAAYRIRKARELMFFMHPHPKGKRFHIQGKKAGVAI